VGKKYIIELDEDPHNIRLMQLKNGGNGVPVTEFKVVCPYKEHDIEQVRKEAYEKGFDAGRMLNTGKYEKGVNDAWEAARTLWNTAKRKEIFGYTVFSTALMSLTGQEAIEKIREYEQKKDAEIKVGDEVGYYGVADEHGNVCYSGIVLEIRKDDYLVMEKDGKTYALKKKLVMSKTDRHFPEIAAVLEKMRGETNE